MSDDAPSSRAPRGEEVPASVVGPTRDRPRQLARCLAALDLVAAGFSRGARVGALVLLAQAATLLGYVSRRPL